MAMTRDEMQRKLDTIVQLMAEVRAAKAAQPELRCGHWPGSPGSLLNAYREGDMSFDDCVTAINDLRKIHPDRDKAG